MKRILLATVLGASLFPAVSQAQTKNVSKAVGIVGIVARAPKGNRFNMRANGQTYLVTVLPKVSLANVKGGDRVRVWGIPTRQTLQRANVRVLASGASNNPEDYAPLGQ